MEDCDLITTSMPVALMRKSHVRFTEQAKSLDRELLDRLEGVGFKLDFRGRRIGLAVQISHSWRWLLLQCWLFRPDRRWQNKSGAILRHRGVRPGGARLHRGDTITADLIVLATGYKARNTLVRKLFGDEIADRVGPIWGSRRRRGVAEHVHAPPQPGLWFIAGSFAQCRIYSKYLAMQIKACEAGLLSLGLRAVVVLSCPNSCYRSIPLEKVCD